MVGQLLKIPASIFLLFPTAVAIGLTSCASLPGADGQEKNLSALDTALDETPLEIHRAADANEGRAQLALSLQLNYGLNGSPVDPYLAQVYRAKALTARSYTTLAVYVPGYNNTPGRTQLISVPVTGVSSLEVSTVEKCSEALAGKADLSKLPRQLANGLCGGEANFNRLQQRWILATTEIKSK